MVIELTRRLRDTQGFLKMAAIELRRIANEAPGIAVELCHIAQKLEAEVADLAHHTEAGLNPAVGAAPGVEL